MNSGKFHIIFIFYAVIVLAAISPLCAQVHSSSAYAYLLSGEDLVRHLEFLTSDKIAGRAAGTPQAREVAEYIAKEFEEYGLQPFRSVSYFQPFSLPGQQSLSYTRQYKMVTGEEDNHQRKGYNIVGYLPASKKNADYIVVGAHFDHIGTIDGKVYPGADDNASGVAALLELAKAFGKRYSERGDFNHNIVFVAFDGNNLNLSGSRYFASHLLTYPAKVNCMLNLDQIGSTLAPVGRNEEYLLILGSNNLEGWQKEQLDFANEYFGLGLHLDYSYYGSREFYDIFYRLSDQQSFTERGIPALLFTSGITKLTNKEGDSLPTLNLGVLHRRIELIYRFLWLLE